MLGNFFTLLRLAWHNFHHSKLTCRFGCCFSSIVLSIVSDSQAAAYLYGWFATIWQAVSDNIVCMENRTFINLNSAEDNLWLEKPIWNMPGNFYFAPPASFLSMFAIVKRRWSRFVVSGAIQMIHHSKLSSSIRQLFLQYCADHCERQSSSSTPVWVIFSCMARRFC